MSIGFNDRNLPKTQQEACGPTGAEMAKRQEEFFAFGTRFVKDPSMAPGEVKIVPPEK
ncbi:hypothetical protein INH39_25525 [Massilia violaceinigra]|uniref:Uncharacterized protein n=1 Tax=Massilia violaceinigra TaxID=2045208 RepID=A0ABY4A1Z8_9BURK|nr:hypothetical protein [Massilia violaceinigra]UOD28772.1 hypothetical protein INH39_25525 [Massilia violaceinigra]